MPCPVAANILPFHATLVACVEKVDDPSPVHVFPLSVDFASVFPPWPVAIHIYPFHATPVACVKKTDFPRPVQLIPSDDFASVFPLPEPAAIHTLPLYAAVFAAVENIDGVALGIHVLPLSFEYVNKPGPEPIITFPLASCISGPIPHPTTMEDITFALGSTNSIS